MGVEKIIRQKDVFDPVLYFRLMDLCSHGRLNHMTQFKSSPDKNKTAHLFTYPVLMAHDVANYDTVIVGEDQTQHLQFAAKLLAQYNVEFDENVIIPKANIAGGRIMDLRNDENKMSKSEPKGCIFLDDDLDTLVKKMRKASVSESGLQNLKVLHDEFIGGERPISNKEIKDNIAVAMFERFQ